jgi:hypothetical protein
MLQDDPGDSVSSIPALKQPELDVVQIVADAIRSQVLGVSIYDAELAAADAIERLKRAGCITTEV